MKSPKELMLEFTAFSFRDPKKATEMFADDGTFEMPYLATFGIPSQYKGRDSIEGFSNSCAISIQASTSRILGC